MNKLTKTQIKSLSNSDLIAFIDELCLNRSSSKYADRALSWVTKRLTHEITMQGSAPQPETV
jgi:hypothetical protein